MQPAGSTAGIGWEAGARSRAWARNLVFYADDGKIARRNHEWVQDALTVTVAMFWHMGIETKLGKNKAMVCTPGFIWGGWGIWPTRDMRREKGKTSDSRRRQG